MARRLPTEAAVLCTVLLAGFLARPSAAQTAAEPQASDAPENPSLAFALSGGDLAVALRYGHDLGATRVSAGRFGLALDNQRFVGPVKWRQDSLTFVAARLENRSLDRTTLSDAFLDRAYTITGGERPMASHLINAAAELPFGTAVGFGYLLDFENEIEAGLSTGTVGLRFSGARPAGPLTIGYESGCARQHDRASNPNRVRAASWKQSLGLKAAFYGADEHSTDTTKVRVWTAYSF